MKSLVQFFLGGRSCWKEEEAIFISAYYITFINRGNVFAVFDMTNAGRASVSSVVQNRSFVSDSSHTLRQPILWMLLWMIKKSIHPHVKLQSIVLEITDKALNIFYFIRLSHYRIITDRNKQQRKKKKK